MQRLGWTAVTILALGLVGAAQAVTPADKCESDKNKQAGKYAYCRQKAESKFAVTGDGAWRAASLQKCLDKYNARWPAIESKAAGTCPSTGDQTAIQQLLDDSTDDVASRLAGGAVAGCSAELAGCSAELASCSADLGRCLLACPAPGGTPLRTGQTQCWNSNASVIPCAGTGHDGELQKGLARAYVDNGDGTITDGDTGLMWEKLADDGSIHDKDNTYVWADAFAVKIAALNAGGGFAGHTDWRLPNQFELYSLVNLVAVDPAVSPAFNTGCAPSCSVTSCSCTQSSAYFSSSTYQSNPFLVWAVTFYDGGVGATFKRYDYYVRAVRGGS